jgi:hypothetical protein
VSPNRTIQPTQHGHNDAVANRGAAEHVLLGYAWFYSDRGVTVPTSATLVRLADADEILAERYRWMALLARN